MLGCYPGYARQLSLCPVLIKCLQPHLDSLTSKQLSTHHFKVGLISARRNMFPGVPPVARVAIRHRKGVLFSIAATALFYVLYQQATTPPEPPRSPTLLRLGPNNLPSFLPNTILPTPTFLLPPSAAPPPVFTPGTPNPPSKPYTKALVIAHTKDEPVTWIHEPLPPSNPNLDPPSTIATTWSIRLYTTDALPAHHDPAALHTPLNKGREAMAYLTHIIDHYASLEDITLFVHAHRSSWHDDQFSLDTPTAITRLNLTHVIHAGYTNLRCAWEPGCPSHIHPGEREFDPNKPEQAVFADAWAEIFPGGGVPEVVSQPCCAQFAVTRERVRQRGVGEYVRLREWVMRTGLEDGVSGRVMEYVYQ